MIFRNPNGFSDSVGVAESHDIKILTKFTCNAILELLIIGGTNLRGRFPMKLCLIAIFNCPVILVYF